MARDRSASVWSNPGHPYWSAPRGRWLIAATPAHQPYPCRCRRCDSRCPCRGRVDGLALMPTHCCARREAETAARHEKRQMGET